MRLTQVSGTQLFKSKSTESREDGPERMICVSLDRFGGVTEPEDGVYFLTREQETEAKEADRLAEIEDLQSEIEDREAELKEMHARLEELLAG